MNDGSAQQQESTRERPEEVPGAESFHGLHGPGPWAHQRQGKDLSLLLIPSFPSLSQAF